MQDFITNFENDILILGGDHHNTLGVIRSLGSMGKKSNVIITPARRSYVIKSRYVKRFIILDNLDELVQIMIKIGQSSKQKIVVFCCSDAISSILDLNINVLLKYYHIPFSGNGEGYLTNLMNKDNMLKLAIKNNIPCPENWTKIEDIKYPCIIKPLVSKNGSKKDIIVCNSDIELKNYMKNKHEASDFQYQKFLDKSFEFQLIGLSLDNGNKVIIPGYTHIIRSPQSTNTGFLKYKNLDYLGFKLLDNCRHFLKDIKYNGTFSIEFIRDKTNHDYFMEINLRNDGNAICVTAAGVNLPYIWYYYNIHAEMPVTPYEIQQEVLVMPEFDDFFLMRQGKVSFKQWIKDIKATDCFMEFSMKDPLPALIRAFWFVKKTLKF